MRRQLWTTASLGALFACVAQCQIGNIVVTNAASFQLGMPPDGSIGTIFCTGIVIPGLVTAQSIPLPFSLAGVTVSVGGLAAPLFAVADLGGFQQINFQAPSELNLNSDGLLPIIVSQNGSQGSVNVDPAPADSVGDFFRLEATQFGIFQHGADYSLVTPENPATAGETLIAYATGLPTATPLVPTGQTAPLSPLSYVKMNYYPADPGLLPSTNYMGLSIDGLELSDPATESGDVTGELPIPFMGLTPGAVGLYQVNFVMPQVAAGNATIRLEWVQCNSHFIYTCPFAGATWNRYYSQPVLLPVH